MNMSFKRRLTIPMEVKQLYPLPEELRLKKAERDAAIRRIFLGEDRRLLMIVGPCSADQEDSVLEYTARLAALAEELKEKLVIVPRVYTGKPRTTGDGYKGLLHQPDPDGAPDLFKGIIATRELHMRVLRETGLSGADELLYPENYKYVDDLLSYVAVGARSVEDQQHRLTASGMEVPAGMKNPLSGDFTAMLNAVHAAQSSHSFIYRGWEAASAGNPFAHAILRGARRSDGSSRPNYHYEDIRTLQEAYAARPELKNPAVIIDTNHDNSGKDPLQQGRIIREVLFSCRENAEIAGLVRGFMVESYLEDGCQPVGGGVYGRSITDPCLGWEKTARLLREVAEMY